MKNKNDLNSSETQLYMVKFLLLLFRPKEALEGALQVHFGYLPGTAISSLVLKDSA